MPENVENTTRSDPFEDPAVSDVWMEVTDLVDDPALAKEIIAKVVPMFWNLPWTTWKNLAKHVSK